MRPSRDRIGIMQALEALVEIALKPDADHRALGIVAAAWEIQGYNRQALASTTIGGGEDDVLDRIAASLRKRPRKLVQAEARGLLMGLDGLLAAGVFTGTLASEARRLIWLEGIRAAGERR